MDELVELYEKAKQKRRHTNQSETMAERIRETIREMLRERHVVRFEEVVDEVSKQLDVDRKWLKGKIKSVLRAKSSDVRLALDEQNRLVIVLSEYVTKEVETNNNPVDRKRKDM